MWVLLLWDHPDSTSWNGIFLMIQPQRVSRILATGRRCVHPVVDRGIDSPPLSGYLEGYPLGHAD